MRRGVRRAQRLTPRELAVYSDELRYLDVARSGAAACRCASMPSAT